MKNKLKTSARRILSSANGSPAAICAVIILVVVGFFPVSARNQYLTQHFNVQQGAAELDQADLEEFLDDFFADQMSNLQIPGAAVTVVQGGEIIAARGYGYADLERNIPVDPANTLMRTGSTCKLVTATAALQMVEGGRLDLNSDVNQYLTDFEIPDNSYGPVTLQQLLTHTAGFEDRVIGGLTTNPEDYQHLGEYLQENIPERVLEPGTIHSYSNFSFGLIGLLVEEQAGVPFASYVDAHIFQPLDMAHSSFEQPLPAELAEGLATGYLVTEDGYEPAGYVYDQISPAGSMSTTAVDMARFMIAHLQDGRYGEAQILNDATAGLMHRQQFTHHPDLPGLGYAFKERFINGERLIGHGGDIGTFSSQLILHLEDDWGFYLHYNVFNDALRERFIAAFMDRFYGQNPTETARDTLDMNVEELARFAGPYRWVRHPRSTMGKLLALIPGPVNVQISANDDSTLSVSFFGAEAEWRFAPVEPLVFRQVSGGVQEIGGLEFDLGDKLVFREDQAGRVDFAFVPLQSVALEKMPWYEGGEAQLGALGSFLVIFVSPFLVWPLGKWIAKIRKRDTASTSGSRRARSLAVILSGLNFIFITTLLFGIGDLSLGVPVLIQAALVIPILTGLLSLALLATAIWAWIKGFWSPGGRIYFSLLTLAALGFTIFARYWNLLGWQY
jgi:CubicO group peptidase (beta-lactamase class C family)